MVAMRCLRLREAFLGPVRIGRQGAFGRCRPAGRSLGARITQSTPAHTRSFARSTISDVYAAGHIKVAACACVRGALFISLQADYDAIGSTQEYMLLVSRIINLIM